MLLALILGAFWPKSSVAAFGYGTTLVLFLTDFVLAIGAVAMPTAIKLNIEKKQKEVQDMFLQWSKIAFSLALVAGLYLVVLGTDFLREWIRDERFDAVGAGRVNTILMLSHFVFLPVRGVGLPILMGLGYLAARAFTRAGRGPAIASLDPAAAWYVGTLSCLAIENTLSTVS